MSTLLGGGGDGGLRLTLFVMLPAMVGNGLLPLVAVPWSPSHADDQFMVCQPDGSMGPDRNDGYFASDTRLGSRYCVTLSRTSPVRLNSSPTAPFSVRFEFVNYSMTTAGGSLDQGTIHLRVDRTIGEGVHEDYGLTNFGERMVELDIEPCASRLRRRPASSGGRVGSACVPGSRRRSPSAPCCSLWASPLSPTSCPGPISCASARRRCCARRTPMPAWSS